MLVDSPDLAPATTLDADLCIVGGGPAGIAVARELAGGPLEVVLLESGGHELEGETQRLYSGFASGTILDDWPGYLANSRLRFLGGSSNHWQGYCRPHDPIDFEVRDWVADSGWPIERALLEPYYGRASELCGVAAFDDASERSEVRALLLRDDPDFETTFYHLSEPVRFGEAYRDELAGAGNLRVVTHANAVRFVADEPGGRVTAVEATSLGGRRLTVRPRGVVLACGGIENARLLLASGAGARGFGNERDLVGRYFMDHPGVGLGYVVLPYRRWLMRPYGSVDFGGERPTARAALRTNDALQRRAKLLNTTLLFERLAPQEATELPSAVSALATDVLQLAEGHPDPKPGFNFFGALRAAVEQVPDRENRVTLADERDALGVPRAAVRWTIGEQVEESLRATVAALVRSLGGELRGRVRFLAEGEEAWSQSRPSNHHMGTTRMATGPDRGVVDTDCRVHGMENLWIAGSSVFPTSGCSNPTLTLLALALRLADHLKLQLRR